MLWDISYYCGDSRQEWWTRAQKKDWWKQEGSLLKFQQLWRLLSLFCVSYLFLTNHIFPSLLNQMTWVIHCNSYTGVFSMLWSNAVSFYAFFLYWLRLKFFIQYAWLALWPLYVLSNVQWLSITVTGIYFAARSYRPQWSACIKPLNMYRSSYSSVWQTEAGCTALA